MAEDADDKTELPTDRRRAEAREQGNIARSRDLSAAGLMLAAATVLSMFATSGIRAQGEMLHGALSRGFETTVSRDLVFGLLWGYAGTAARITVPPMLLLALVALCVNLAQVGFLLAPDVLQFKLSRINPLAGAKRIVSKEGIVRLGVSLGKLTLVAIIAAWVISGFLPMFLDLAGLDWLTIADPTSASFREHRPAPLVLEQIRSSLISLAFQMASALAVLALLEFGFQKWKHEQDLMMTKQELRDEMKTMEGNPHVRQRRREIHRKLAEARQITQAKDADVIITNPTHISVALKYDPQTMSAPTVVAKGMGEIALRIRQIAAENGVPIIERKPLARALYKDVKVGHTIPLEMYEVFVEIMAYIYRLGGRRFDGPK